jgi:DNA topoisomerase I
LGTGELAVLVWVAGTSGTSGVVSVTEVSTGFTEFPCPVCDEPLEVYSYNKDGQPKRMLWCSDEGSRGDRKE